MKIILLHTKTGLFIGDDRNWTKEPREARSFETIVEAISFCTAKAIEDIHYMLRFDRPDIQPLALGPAMSMKTN